MGEPLRVHTLTAGRLNPVVSDRRGREPFLDVPRIQLVSLLRRIGPDPGIAVGLELHPNGEVVHHVGPLLLRPPHLSLGAEQPLHVMAELVRDHVGLREIARGPESVP